jgi:RelA/SpoT family protein
VVGSISDVRALAEGLRGLRGILPGFELKTTKDYIQNPAPSGYRGLHLVYPYRSQGDEDRNLDGLRIEVQIRTRLQHVWATAVEMVGNLRGESLKSGEGSPEWLELFRLAGHVVEARQRPLSRLPKLPPELVALRDRLRVMDRMRFYGAAIKGINYGLEYDKEAVYFLIVLNLDRENPTVEVTGYPPRAFQQAAERYRDEEHKGVGKPVDVVLVSAESPEDVREAYPNYFAEVGDFINLVYAESGDEDYHGGES